MKRLKLLSLLAILGIIFFSCQKELSNESGNPGPAGAQWEFTEGTATFKGTIDTAYLEPAGGFQSFVFEGGTADGKGQIFLQVVGTSITATNFKNPNVSFAYVENGSIVYSNIPTEADAFTVVITTLNATSVTGTFSGEVENSAGEKKTITNGKFSASFQAVTTPPLQGICKVSNIAFLDSASSKEYSSVASSFNSANKVTGIQYIATDPSNGSKQVLLNFNLNHTATRVNIDAEQYFELDANGRIKTFNGYFDGVKDTTTPKLIITYTFNANGNLIRAAYAEPSTPTFTQYAVNFTWTNGNLTQTATEIVGTKLSTHVDYVYDASKTAKDFICLFPNFEVFYAQSAINYGKNSVNLPIKSTITEYNTNGDVEDSSVATFTGYSLDAQNYVKTFNVVGEGAFLPGRTKYALSYKCF